MTQPRPLPGPRGAEERLVIAVTRFAAAGSPLGSDQVAVMLQTVSWRSLGELLGRLHLVELVGTALQELAAQALPAEFSDWIDRTRRATAHRATVHELMLSRVLAALSASGIPAAPIKGVVLAREAFGRTDLRASADLDLLLHDRDLGRACAVLGELGWDPPADLVDTDGLPLHHFRLYAAKAPTVELHWRTQWYEREFDRAALDRAEPDSGALRLDRRDHLAMLLLGYARDGFRGLRTAADIAALARRLDATGESLHDDRVPVTLRPAISAASAAVEILLGVCPIVSTGPRADTQWRGRAALALGDPLLQLPGSSRWADPALIDVLLAPSSQVGPALGRALWPRLTAIPRRPGAGRVRARLARPEHAARVLRGFALAQPRIARALPARRR